MATPFRFEINDHGNLLVVLLRGHVDHDAASAMFGKIGEVMLAKNRPCGLLYDPSEPFSFDRSAIEQAKALMKRLDGIVTRTAVVSPKTSVRFALSMIQLVTGAEVKSFGSLPEAKEWILAGTPH